MAKKERKKPLSIIKEVDLASINKVKEAREKQEISHRTLENKAGIAEGYISNAENPRLTTKYSLGHLNKIVKAINQTMAEKSVSGNKRLAKTKKNEAINLHNLLPAKPVLSKKKIQKLINPSVKGTGPKNAILTLITNGFLDHEFVNLDTIATDCLRLFGKSFIRKSLSHRLNILSEEGILTRYKSGEPHTFHYKKTQEEKF